MNILVDLLPETIEVDGDKYAINSDFRTGILFEELMLDNKLLDKEKAAIALRLYYKVIPHDIDLAIEKIKWFYMTGKEPEKVSGGNEGPANKEKRIYSYEHDAEYIYTAFLSQYGVDLQDIERLHWWKFKAMFLGLKEDNLIVKIMGYRSMKITNDMSKEQKKFYKQMKKVYGIPDLRSESEKEIDFHDSLGSLL